MRRNCRYSGFGGGGRSWGNRQPRFPGFGHVSRGLFGHNAAIGTIPTLKYAALLAGRLNGTIVNNFGGGNVHHFNYGAIPIGNIGAPIVVNPPVLKPADPPVLTPSTNPGVPAKPGPLTVNNVNLKVSANSAAHRTSRYAISAPNNPNAILVVRRGQSFNIDIYFSKPYDENKDDLKLIFEAGNNPLPAKGTYVEFILSAEDKPKEWGAKITSNAGNTVSADIFTPPTCSVGKWVLKINVIKKKGADVNILTYQHKNPIYIIFNPWCPDDTVYMPEEQLLREYVLNESGLIYQGTKEYIASKYWNFGQFESCVLDLTFYLLDVSGLNWAVRGNPGPIVRKIAALINSQDDQGILYGSWEKVFHGGVSPQAWTGSVAILDRYWKNKQPVKYGQCWVFSGIATTICRSLGIPTRSVTNFGSAHDSDGSITIDIHLKANGEIDKNMTRDSVWNFHVWNECYMSRPDLPPGYGGWQVIDATPQETSDGVYCVGPTSVIAIQNGEVNLPYDGPFVFAEINGDMSYWKPNNLGVSQCITRNTFAIGNCISTKAVNSNARQDITSSYKHTEGSPEERASVLKANQVGSKKPLLIYKKTVDDVKFSIIQESANNWVGASFHIGLNIKNNSTATRTISGRIIVNTMFYTGVSADKLKSEPFTNIVLQPGQEKRQMIEVKQDDYDGKLKDHCMLNATILAQVTETEQSFTIKESYTLRKPNLIVKAPSETVAGKEFKIDVSFTNPLKSSLTGCFLKVDGVCPVIKFPQGNVAPFGTFTATVPITPNKVGKRDIIILFNSVQLEDINTSCSIKIRAQ